MPCFIDVKTLLFPTEAVAVLKNFDCLSVKPRGVVAHYHQLFSIIM